MKNDADGAPHGDDDGAVGVPAHRGVPEPAGGDAVAPVERQGSSGPMERQGPPPGGLAERQGPSALQVARGAGGLGVVWGGAWAGISGAVGLAAALLTGFPLDLVPMIAPNSGVVGPLSGAAFALILSATERRGSIEGLGYLRMSLLGAVGAFVVGMVTLVVAGALPVLGIGGIALQGVRS